MQSHFLNTCHPVRLIWTLPYSKVKLLTDFDTIPMYDTVNLWLSKEKAGDTDLFSKPELHLTGITEYKREGYISHSGHYRNYKVNISEAGISFKGSIAKNQLNDNYQTLTRGDSQRAFEKMKDELHIPIDRAKVTRIDFAQNFIVKHPPEAYYNYLGDCTHYHRLMQPNSLYYNNGLRKILFYNKIAQGKKIGMPVPVIFQGKNILRYELSHNTRLPYQFNMPEITTSHLYNELFYMGMVNRWVQQYEAINKLKIFTPKIENPMTATQSQKILFAALVSQVGQNEVLQMVEQWHSQSLYTSDREYFRAKGQIKVMMKKVSGEHNELITELDKKVRAVKLNYR